MDKEELKIRKYYPWMPEREFMSTGGQGEKWGIRTRCIASCSLGEDRKRVTNKQLTHREVRWSKARVR